MKEPAIQLDNSPEEVIQHLTFHKSLIDEKRNGERIDDYIQMVENMDEEGKEFSDDPFDNAIASIFKLVIDEKMDPWEIDLVSFTEMYLEQAKNKENLNFLVTGQLINMAWSILKMQCEQVLYSAEEEEQEEPVEEEGFFDEWEIWDQGLYEDPEDLDYEEEVLNDDDLPLERAVRREEKKPVSLIQLVDAFEDAKQEAKYREKMEKIRKEKKKEREEELKEREENYDTRSHEEDIQSEISKIWKRICCYEQKVITLSMIHDDRKKDIITALMSILFLNKQKKIKVKQTSYPDGQILVENLVPEEKRQNGLMELTTETQEEGLSRGRINVY
ncbi:MAG: segregation/condensation protein A [Candidatus Thermoplasmatota archaeon]|nr:segregation/condensation protein A [Candidatus Thermoplasmatota archaeon]